MLENISVYITIFCWTLMIVFIAGVLILEYVIENPSQQEKEDFMKLYELEDKQLEKQYTLNDRHLDYTLDEYKRIFGSDLYVRFYLDDNKL